MRLVAVQGAQAQVRAQPPVVPEVTLELEVAVVERLAAVLDALPEFPWTCADQAGRRGCVRGIGQEGAQPLRAVEDEAASGAAGSGVASITLSS